MCGLKLNDWDIGTLQGRVTPLAGVWIEIATGIANKLVFDESHPSRVCGLKCCICSTAESQFFVTPLAGVWIEIISDASEEQYQDVTPLAGVWIEI